MFEKISLISTGKSCGWKIQAVHMLELSKYKTVDTSKSIDLKSGNWAVKEGKFDWVKPDATMFRLDVDFI